MQSRLPPIFGHDVKDPYSGCLTLTVHTTGGVIMFGFPLSLMRYDQAWNALSIAVNDLGADTTWTGLEPEIDLATIILQ